MQNVNFTFAQKARVKALPHARRRTIMRRVVEMMRRVVETMRRVVETIRRVVETMRRVVETTRRLVDPLFPHPCACWQH